MSRPYYEPWIGKHFNKTRNLVISESAYDWLGDDGNLWTPTGSHARDSIAWHAERFGANRYFQQINRALCREEKPGSIEIMDVWQKYAYTIYVQGSVGFGPGKRPSAKLWRQAKDHFLALLEDIQPLRVVVTGKDAWNRMPECATHIVNDIQAYRLQNGNLVWCLAVPHPANRREGFNWKEVGESIHNFTATSFPKR